MNGEWAKGVEEPTVGDDGANESRRASRVRARPPHHDDYCLLPLQLLLLLLLLLDTTTTTTTNTTNTTTALLLLLQRRRHNMCIVFYLTGSPPLHPHGLCIPEGTVREGLVEGKKKTFSATRLRAGVLQRVHTHAHNNIYRVIVLL
jgi:hypothetical protein